jgi:single stranded DNA-binding protein
MNTVALIGALTDAPELTRNREGIEVCRMRIAVPRRNRGGRREPGVVYVEVVTFGAEAIACAERLKRGDRIGLSGRLERDDYVVAEGERRTDHGVLVEQLDLLTEEGSNGALR